MSAPHFLPDISFYLSRFVLFIQARRDSRDHTKQRKPENFHGYLVAMLKQ